MDAEMIFMAVGFLFAGYSVIGNDSIQTLGTFLASNEKRPWWVLWLFAGSILAATLLYGWYANAGDVSYGRLSKYPLPEPFYWFYLLPPLILMIITRFGIPVSTSFMILTFFNPKNLYDMVAKSLMGYVVALFVGGVVYFIVSRALEKRFIENPIQDRHRPYFVALQWLSTAFLWSMWLIQDFANIYVYLPRELSNTWMFLSLGALLGMLGIIFYLRGGSIQQIVKSKTNTTDIRSATIIDFLFALILLFFKEINDVPMSTTWVFIGLLAGRELTLRYRLNKRVDNDALRNVALDLGKVFFGLFVSIALVFIVKWLSSFTV